MNRMYAMPESQACDRIVYRANRVESDFINLMVYRCNRCGYRSKFLKAMASAK